jgi:hypothetical protein
VRDADEDIFALREECIRFQEDLKTARFEKETLQQDIDYKQNLLQKYEFDLQRQVETVAYLNNEVISNIQFFFSIKNILESSIKTRIRKRSKYHCSFTIK